MPTPPSPARSCSSSTITAIIQIIQQARTRNVPLVLQYDPSKRWQTLGFEPLKVLATKDDLVEFVAKETAS